MFATKKKRRLVTVVKVDLFYPPFLFCFLVFKGRKGKEATYMMLVEGHSLCRSSTLAFRQPQVPQDSRCQLGVVVGQVFDKYK